jgi:ribose transport system substrate-binding protein
MRKIYLSFLCTIIILAFFLLTDLFAKVNEPLIDPVTFDKLTDNEQYAVLIPRSKEYRWELLIKGVERARKEHNISIEIMEARDASEQLELLRTAIYSKKDGIIIYPMGEEEYIEEVNHAISKGIPVVSILSDIPDSKRNSFIGESVQSSYLAASEFIGATNGQASVAIVVNDLSSFMHQERLKGATQSFQRYPDINIVLTEEIPTDQILATKNVEQMLKDHPDINAIIGIDSNSTIAAARAAMNLDIHNITIMGFDAPTNLLHYIDQGDVYGTITQDTNFIGYVAVRYLRNINLGKWVPEKLNAEMRFITHENVTKLLSDEYKGQGK